MIGTLKKLEATDIDGSTPEVRLERPITRDRKPARDARNLMVPGDGWLGGAGRFLARI